jgi:hypothetical protein
MVHHEDRRVEITPSRILMCALIIFATLTRSRARMAVDFGKHSCTTSRDILLNHTLSENVELHYVRFNACTK